MSLHLRHVRLDELVEVRDLIAVAGRDSYTTSTLGQLPAVWAQLLRQRRLEMHVIEDTTARPRDRLLLVASGVFITDDLGDRLVAHYAPGVAEPVITSELAGTSEIVDRDTLATANATNGVTALGLDFAYRRPEWSSLLRLSQLMIDSARGWVDGWRLRLVIREVIGRDFHLVARAMGVATYGRHVRDARGTSLAPAHRRYLMGWSREDVERRPYTLPSLLYRERAPQLGFSMGEQDLLVLALRNHSDEEAAELLGISPNTVKLRWRQIFDRVAAARPDWFPRGDTQDARRGVEKRRHLLAYLARHPEELRPRATRARGRT